MASATPRARFEVTSKHVTLLRALYAHPEMKLTPEGTPDRSKIPATLFNVTDFELSTYNNYLCPLLPPDAPKNSKALAITNVDGVKENGDLMKDDMYPRMNDGSSAEKWTDSVGRTVMITQIILTPMMHAMFGGPFTFSEEVKRAARALQ